MKYQKLIHKVIVLALLVVLLVTGCVSAEMPTEPTEPSEPGPVATQPPVEPEPVVTEPPAAPAPGESPSASSKVMKSDLPRDTAPQVPVPDAVELAAGNRAFAMDFYQATRGQDGNLFFSPYSLSMALAMTYAGARNETAAQMARTMHYTLEQERLHPAFNAVDLQLAAESMETNTSDEAGPFRLNIANSLWAQYDYPFLPDFLDMLGRNYGAGLRLVDYKTAPEPARLEINQWVEDNTEGKIKDLIPEGEIDILTRLVLANAIYFKADWLEPFVKDMTHDAPFYLLDGGQVSVPMMGHGDPINMPYMQGDGFQAVEIPYVGERVAMLVLVPDAGNFENFEAGLDAARLEEIRTNLTRGMIKLDFPKFKFSSEYQLAKTLTEMGMPDAFDSLVADFSGMDGTTDLYIGDVFHKAFVAVDEQGTEAAAATAVVMKLEVAVMPQAELTVDRPFIFMILDKTADTILFVGRVLNPAGDGSVGAVTE